jgi:phosphate transport system permease protein
MAETAALSPGSVELFDRPFNLTARITNAVMLTLCTLSALLAISMLLLIMGYLFYKGISSLNWALFTQNLDKNPDSDYFGQRIGFQNGIQGTIVLIGLASLFGVPAGVACGVYLAEYSRVSWIGNALRLIVDILVGVPSIIVGVLAYQLVVAPYQHSAWAGAAALAFIMTPIVARTTEEMLRLVPKSYREASIGVGASGYQTLFRVVLPAARAGIITGVMLAVARVAGETAPLIFTLGGTDLNIWGAGRQHAGLGDKFPSLTMEIWQLVQQPDEKLIGQAWAGMLVLVSMVLMLNAGVRYFSRDKMTRS